MVGEAIVVTAAVVVALGVRSGAARARGLFARASNTADDLLAAFLKLNVVDPDPCGEECSRWTRERRESSALEQAIAVARQSIDATSAAYTRALAQLGAFIALALSAAHIPFIGWAVAQAFFLVAAGFAAYAAYLLGILLAAERALQDALTKLQQSRAEEQAAWLALLAHCPAAVVAKCESGSEELLRTATDLR